MRPNPKKRAGKRWQAFLQAAVEVQSSDDDDDDSPQASDSSSTSSDEGDSGPTTFDPSRGGSTNRRRREAALLGGGIGGGGGGGGGIGGGGGGGGGGGMGGGIGGGGGGGIGGGVRRATVPAPQQRAGAVVNRRLFESESSTIVQKPTGAVLGRIIPDKLRQARNEESSSSSSDEGIAVKLLPARRSDSMLRGSSRNSSDVDVSESTCLENYYGPPPLVFLNRSSVGNTSNLRGTEGHGQKDDESSPRHIVPTLRRDSRPPSRSSVGNTSNLRGTEGHGQKDDESSPRHIVPTLRRDSRPPSRGAKRAAGPKDPSPAAPSAPDRRPDRLGASRRGGGGRSPDHGGGGGGGGALPSSPQRAEGGGARGGAAAAADGAGRGGDEGEAGPPLPQQRPLRPPLLAAGVRRPSGMPLPREFSSRKNSTGSIGKSDTGARKILYKSESCTAAGSN